jgi:negative regulator of sigma-B (phosphoserine phosphatase)
VDAWLMDGWSMKWACCSRPLSSESSTGDASVVAAFEGGTLLAVIDGLGHGDEAAAAAQRAVATLRERPALSPADQIARCHADLRGTRGAVMLVISISFQAGQASWCGIGNIEGWFVTSATRTALISRPGVIGYQIARPREQTATVALGDLIVLATDGVEPSFSTELSSDADPADLAARILSVHGRSDDDALVLVARCEAQP